MAANTKIEWADHTFNPWLGCLRVGPGCDNCYAESWAKRAGSPELWNGERRRTKTWREPIKWNRQAEAEKQRYKVFGGSLCDPFDNAVPDEWRADYWELIKSTPYLDWIIVTKRIGNAIKMMPSNIYGCFHNVWLIATVCTQEEFDRDVPKLKATPAIRRGLSMEPLIEPVNVHAPGLDWIIVGGESGPKARHMNSDWARAIRDKCKDAGVAFFMKQMAARAPIPPDLMVREWPA